MTEYMDIYKYPRIKEWHMIRQINVEKGKTRATGARTDRQTDRQKAETTKNKKKSIKN